MKLKERHRTIKGVEQKLCSKCKKWKSLSLFYKKSTQPNKLKNWCKKCYIKSVTKHRRRTKDSCFEHYGGYICVRCGTTDKEVLTLDHINDDGAEMRKTIFLLSNNNGGHASGNALYSRLIKHNFPSEHKLQVLCWNCQAKKEMKRRKREYKERMKNL